MEEAADPGVRVRRAIPADLRALTLLRATAGWGSGGLEGGFAAASAGRLTVLVAEADDQAIGTVTASFSGATGQPRSGHISDLVVAPRWRRRGVASLLLTVAEEAVKRQGLRSVTLDVDVDNAGAIRLYVGRGYRRLGPARFPWGAGHTLVKELAPGLSVAGPRGASWMARLRQAWGGDDGPKSPGWRRLRRILLGEGPPLPR